MTKTSTAKLDAYIKKVLIYDGDACLTNWPGSRDVGRPKRRINGKVTLVHRWICEQVNGPPPFPKAEACHDCGNGNIGCLTPHHLRWDTHAGNQHDMIRHGTSPLGRPSPLRGRPNLHTRGPNWKIQGERNGFSFITEHEIHVILEMYAAGTRQSEIASRFNISRTHTHNIVHGKRWKHLSNKK